MTGGLRRRCAGAAVCGLDRPAPIGNRGRMFPIRDHNPTRTAPYVTIGLIIVNVAIFIASMPLMSSEQAITRFFMEWGMVPARVTGGDGYHTLFTSMFLHAGFAHLLGNMVFLWIFGDNMEDRFGHFGFLLFYLASGVGAALFHLLSAPVSTVPTVGASGAIAGVMGGYLLLYPRARVDVLIIFVFFIDVITLPAWWMLGLWFVMQFFGGLAADPTMGGVAYWAHAGGFIVGAALTLPIWLRDGGTGYWSRTHGLPPFPETRYRFGRSHVPRVPRRRSGRR